jgi:hypothetical protein
MSGFPTGPTGSGGGGSIANPLPVSGPATNAELRATPLPVHDLGLRVEPGDVMVVTITAASNTAVTNVSINGLEE